MNTRKEALLNPMPVAVKKSEHTHTIMKRRDILRQIGKNQIFETELLLQEEPKAQNLLVFVPEAYRELEGIIHFGGKNGNNILEQQIRGCGHYFSNGSGGFTTVVTHIQKIYSSVRSKTGASVMKENQGTLVYEQLEKELNWINQCELEMYHGRDRGRDPFYSPENPVVAVCWIHTHPQLHAWFSGTDKENITCAAGDPWVSLCIDPIRKEFKAISGQDNEPTSIAIYYYAENPLRTLHMVEKKMELLEMSEVEDDKNEILNQIRLDVGQLLRDGDTVKGGYQEFIGWRNTTNIKIKLKIKKRRRKRR